MNSALQRAVLQGGIYSRPVEAKENPFTCRGKAGMRGYKSAVAFI
jgi:hypothetical protein